jgi:hypothetical protein
MAPGAYVFVQDCFGVVWLAPDGPHVHPRVLGGARPVVAAGEMTLGESAGRLHIKSLAQQDFLEIVLVPSSNESLVFDSYLFA